MNSGLKNPLGLAWDLARPWWRFSAAALACNLMCALFEGSAIGLLTIALQVLSNPPNFLLAHNLGTFGSWLDGMHSSLGKEPFFLSLVLLAILAQVLRSGFQFAADAATAHLRSRVQWEVHRRIFSRIMHLPFSKSSSYPLGNLTDFLGRGLSVQEVFARLNDLARNVLLVGSYLVLLFWLSWPMTLATIALYGLVSRLLRRIMLKVRQHTRQAVASSVSVNERATEFLQALRLLHSHARQEQAVGAVQSLARKALAEARSATMWSNAVEPLTDIITVTGAGLLLLGGFLARSTPAEVALPLLLAFLLALHRVGLRIRAVYSNLTALTQLLPNVDRIGEILQEEEDPSGRVGRPFLALREGIEFRGVALRYLPDEPPAVLDLSFRIPRGSFTALVGASGAGKSSVADLLLRLYEPTAGRILVDGADLAGCDRIAWRNRLGVVAQDPFLFHTTIRENIAFGRPEAAFEEIAAAAKAAHADAFISKLANGCDTVVGDRGYRLSGGQCQRIILARALLRRPDLLILDEATSALDSESESLIQQALDEQRGERTVFAIAHRLSTVAHADQILVMAEGRLVEQGTHPELLERQGVYARLWKLQSEDPTRNPTHLLKESCP